ncbi:two component transcriptional regulator, LuxR family [Candidatus Magnetomorum sp. HK-1]|nr:two component transcriptional regulator, LuxR family [Candidatus Magnetomorum sp. HK-1]
MNKKSRVILAENQFIVREGLKALLAKLEYLTVIADVDNGAEAVEIIKKTKPDLIIVDIMMPKMNGIEVIREVKKELPSLKCLVLSAYQEDEYIFASMEAGADGYLLKDTSFDELKIAIKSILQGKSYIGADITKVVLDGFLYRKNTPQNDTSYTTRWDMLTRREKEIANNIANGVSNKNIADQLCISIKTVATHRSNIMKKLNISNSSALTAFVIERRNALQTLS